MGKHPWPLGFSLGFCFIILLGFISFVSCIIAETKRLKRGDLRLDGDLCYLPESDAFEFGVAALICLSAAQVAGNLLVSINFCTREKERKAKKPIIATILLVSWISFGIAIILMGIATSMSRTQHYGEGWLDGDCYIVKPGVFIGSAALSLVTVFALLGAAIVTTRTTQVDQGRKVHAQIA